MTDPVNSVHQHLAITICADAQDAIEQGFNWSADANVHPIEIEKVVVVRNGTNQGNATVDLVLRDGTGKRFVCMVTRRLLQSIPG